MESKTLSKADTLKGLVELRDNQFNVFIQQACEHEVQNILGVLLDPKLTAIPECTTKILSLLGEMRGLRNAKMYLDTAIAQLTEEVRRENNPQPEKETNIVKDEGI